MFSITCYTNYAIGVLKNCLMSLTCAQCNMCCSGASLACADQMFGFTRKYILLWYLLE